MHANKNPAVVLHVKFQRRNIWIDQIPLPRPVSPDPFVTLYAPTFHTVWPIHIRMHVSQSRIQVAVIEGLVSLCEDILICQHKILLYDESFTQEVVSSHEPLLELLLVCLRQLAPIDITDRRLEPPQQIEADFLGISLLEDFVRRDGTGVSQVSDGVNSNFGKPLP